MKRKLLYSALAGIAVIALVIACAAASNLFREGRDRTQDLYRSALPGLEWNDIIEFNAGFGPHYAFAERMILDNYGYVLQVRTAIPGESLCYTGRQLLNRKARIVKNPDEKAAAIFTMLTENK